MEEDPGPLWGVKLAMAAFLLMFLAGPITLVIMGVTTLVTAEDSTSASRTATVVDRFASDDDGRTLTHGLIVEFAPGATSARQRTKVVVSEATWLAQDPGTTLTVYGKAGELQSFTTNDEASTAEDGMSLITGGIGLGVFMVAGILILG